MAVDKYGRIEFDVKAAQKLLKNLEEAQLSAEQRSVRLVALADRLETVWRHRDAKQVSELIRLYARRYGDLARDAQTVAAHLEETSESIAHENARRYGEWERQHPTLHSQEHLDPAQMRDREERRREEQIRLSVTGPEHKPWQSSVH